MNYEIAVNLLELIEPITFEKLKKTYRKLALRNHPDKNGNTVESCERFRVINEAYQYLKHDFDNDNDNDNQHDKDDEFDNMYKGFCDNSYSYTELMTRFLSGLKYSDIFIKIIGDLLASKFSWVLIEKLDSEMLLNVYNFLSCYRSVFHVSDDVLCRLKDTITNKCNHVYILNPSLSDLLDNNIFKLTIENDLYLVPLWHKELFFDCSNNSEIVVICEPQLPTDVQIDEDNNILVDITINQRDIFNNDALVFSKEKLIFAIPFNKLVIKREQIYILKKQGISKIKEDIYNISEKSDIIVNIHITPF
jgi:hypothetical protein